MNLRDEELERIKQKKLATMVREAKEKGSRSSVRVVIPVLDETGLDAQLSEHFGRAPYFAVIDINEGGKSYVKKLYPISVNISAELDAHLTESCNLNQTLLSRMEWAREL